MVLSKFQLERKILDFVEGLRTVGILPDQKIALFADNSCRWLVADQGIFSHLKISNIFLLAYGDFVIFPPFFF